ncbi:MAG: ROK family protein [Bacteroidetes bacterium]|jgi:glucokinase-like ROK family protein|nr:ROK family protein [Bacteroidota bacterium]
MKASKNSTVKGQTLLRQRNVSVVIDKINSEGPITNREIENTTGISFAKVNTITTMLNKIGLTIESGKEESNGGRRSSLFQLNPNYMYTIGCQLSHTRIHVIIGNLKGQILFESYKPFNKSDGKDSVMKLLVDTIKNLMKTSGIPREKYLGIGVSIAGLFNPKDEMTLPFPHLVKWGNVAIKDIIENKFALHCYLNNVANAAALAELNYGAGQGKDSILYLNIGTGLGMGIVLNGKLYEGVSGTAGEFGHISIDDHGPLCECGNLGCLEAVASTKAVVNQAKTLLKQGVSSVLLTMTNDDPDKLDFELICQAANESDKLAYNLIDKMGQNLGEGIVTLINLFNPSRIILGGKIISANNLINNSIFNIVQKRALEIPRRNTEIVFSEMGSRSGTIGATVPIIEKFFQDQITDCIN